MLKCPRCGSAVVKENDIFGQYFYCICHGSFEYPELKPLPFLNNQEKRLVGIAGNDKRKVLSLSVGME